MNIPALLLGGEQEEKAAAGTENLAGSRGMAKGGATVVT